jgi:hypothetical protein
LQLVHGILRFCGRRLDAVTTSNAVAVQWFHAGVKCAVPRAFMAKVVADTAWQHNTTMEIRDATLKNADAACLVIRRSIAELCVADHGSDKAIPALLSGKRLCRGWNAVRVFGTSSGYPMSRVLASRPG